MEKYNRETLMVCASGDDKELSDYSKKLLKQMKYEIPDIRMFAKRIPDTTIMELYHSADKFLVRKAKELAITYHINHIYDIIHRYFYQFEDSYFEDMFQSGAIGILKSLEHYDGSASLRTYSRFYVVHEISGFTYFIRKYIVCSLCQAAKTNFRCDTGRRVSHRPGDCRENRIPHGKGPKRTADNGKGKVCVSGFRRKK